LAKEKQRGNSGLEKLPVFPIIRDAVRVTYRHRGAFFRTLIVPALLLAASDTYQMACLGDETEVWPTLLSFVFYLFVATLFAVCAHRVILLGDEAVPRYGLFRWTMRETRFLGWTLLIGTTMVLILVALGVAEFRIGGVFDLVSGREFYEMDFEFFSLPTLMFLPLVIPAAYIPSRWALLLPATAVGERRGIRWAWQATEHNGLRMVLLVVLPPVLFAFFPAYEAVQLNVVLGFMANLVTYVLLVIEVAVLSLAYRHFTAPGSGVDK
jgi:hypothetical protein